MLLQPVRLKSDRLLAAYGQCGASPCASDFPIDRRVLSGLRHESLPSCAVSMTDRLPLRARRIGALACLLSILVLPVHAGEDVRISGESRQDASGVVLESGAYREGSEITVCAERPFYRKKLAVFGFVLEQPRDAADLQHVSDGMAQMFKKRLQANGEWLIRLLPEQTTRKNLPRSELHDLWMNRGIQFALLVRMEDMSMQRAGQHTRFQFPSGVPLHNGKRGLAATLYIHDTLTGELIASIPYVRTVPDSDFNAPALNLLSAEFAESEYGQAVESMLDEFGRIVAEALSCIPFMARVIEARQGEVVLDAGHLNGLKAGDNLLIHHQQRMLGRIEGPHGEGRIESPIASITLTRVQPNIATGIIEPNSSFDVIRPGDIARAP